MKTARSKTSKSVQLKIVVSLSHLLHHLYIGVAPLLFPLLIKDLTLSLSQIGLVISMRTFFAGFFQIFFSFLRRSLTRKAILNMSNLLLILSSLGMSISHSFHHFLFFNGLWGLATSPIHPLGGSLAWTSFQKKEGFNVGIFYSYAYLGNIIGVVITILLIHYIGWRGIFFVMALFTLPLLITTSFIQEEESETEKPLIKLRKALKNRRVVFVSLAGLLFFGGTNCFIRHLAPLFLTNNLHLSIRESSLIFFLMCVIGIFSPPLFGWLLDRLRTKWVMTSIGFLLSCLFYLITFNLYVIPILLLQAFLTWPILAMFQTFSAKILNDEVKDAGVEILLAVNIVSLIIWATFLGYMIDITGSFTLPFYLVSIGCIISIPLIHFSE